uniref:Uncharacterized protein n=1 Tax=Myotis myotis TaxID=51298 RepID=A0A7J7XZX0_MYOMY|nr:hypothetical protein mMyoMyo1_011370 [Myotis myotis]
MKRPGEKWDLTGHLHYRLPTTLHELPAKPRLVQVKECCCKEEWTYVDNSRTGNKLPVRGLMGVRIGNRSIPRSNIKATLPVSQEFTVSLCSPPHPTPTSVLFSSALLCLLILHVAFKWLTYDHQVGPDHLCPKSPVIQQY